MAAKSSSVSDISSPISTAPSSSSGGAAGLLARIAAFGIAVNMAVAALVVHAQYGFFINWTGQQAGNGFEYQILAIGLALVVMLKGGGAFSLDRLLARKIGQ
jgi:putative oxidoreductase